MDNIIFGSCVCDKIDVYLFDTAVSALTDGIQCGAAESFMVSVRSQKNGTAWHFSTTSNATWVHAATLSNMEQILVDVDENTGNSERTATITLTQNGSGKVITIAVKQGYLNSPGCKYLVSIDWDFYMESDDATSCETSGTYGGLKVYERSTKRYSNGEVVIGDYALTSDYSVSYSPSFTVNTDSTGRDINLTVSMTRQTGATSSDVKTYSNSGDDWKIYQAARTMGSWSDYSETPVMLDVTRTSPSGMIPQTGGSAVFSATYSYNMVQRRYNTCDSSDYDTQTLTGFTKDVTDSTTWSANTSYSSNVITVGENNVTSTVTYTMSGTYKGLTDTATVQQQKKPEITATTYDAKITALATSIRACDSLSYKVEERPTYYYDDGTNDVGSYTTANPSNYVVSVKNGATIVDEGTVSQYTGTTSRTLTLSLANSSSNRYNSFGSAASVTQSARTLTAGAATTSKVNESVTIEQSVSTLGNGGGTNTYALKYTSTVRTSTPYYDACGNYVNTTTSDASPTTVDVTSSSQFTITSNPDNAASISSNTMTVGSNDNTSSRTFIVSGSYNGLSDEISVEQEGTVKITATTYEMSISASNIKCCENVSETVTERPVYHWSDGTTTYGSWTLAPTYDAVIKSNGSTIPSSDVSGYTGTSSRTLTITASDSKYSNSPVTATFTQSAYSTTTGSGVYFDNYVAWNAGISSTSVPCSGGSCDVTVTETWSSGYTYPVYNPCGSQVSSYDGSVANHNVNATSSASYSITAGSSYASVDSNGKVTVSSNSTDYDITINVQVTYRGSSETKAVTLLACNCTESCAVSATTSSSTIEACNNAPTVYVYTKTTTACTSSTTDSGWISTSNYSVSWSPSPVSGYTGSSQRTITGTVSVNGCGSYTVYVTQKAPTYSTGSSSYYSSFSNFVAYANSSSISCDGGSTSLSQRNEYSTGYSASVTDACGNYIRTEYSNVGTSYESVPSSSCTYTVTSGSSYASVNSSGVLTMAQNNSGYSRQAVVKVTNGSNNDSVTVSQSYCEPASITSTTYEMSVSASNIKCCENVSETVTERPVYHWSDGTTTYGSWTLAPTYDAVIKSNGSTIPSSDVSGYTGTSSRTLTITASDSKYSNSPVTATFTQSGFTTTEDNTPIYERSINALLLTASTYSLDCGGGSVTIRGEIEYEEVEKYKQTDPCGNVTGYRISNYSYPTSSVTPTFSIVSGSAYASVNGSTITISSNNGTSDVTITVRGSYAGETEDVSINLYKCEAPTVTCEVSATTSSSTIEACENWPSITCYSRSVSSYTSGDVSYGSWTTDSSITVKKGISSVSSYKGTTSRTLSYTASSTSCGSYVGSITQNAYSTTESSFDYKDYTGATWSALNNTLSCSGGSVSLYPTFEWESGTTVTTKDKCGNFISSSDKNVSTGTTAVAYLCSFSLSPSSAGSMDSNVLTLNENTGGGDRNITVTASYNSYTSTWSYSQPACSITAKEYDIFNTPSSLTCSGGTLTFSAVERGSGLS